MMSAMSDHEAGSDQPEAPPLAGAPPPAFVPPGGDPPPPAPGAPGAQPWSGYGYPPPPPPPPAQTGTNPFAIAALVLGLIGAFPLGIIFALVALRQVRRTGQQGKGMAIAGLILSVLWLIAIVVMVSLFLADRAERDESGAISQGGDVMVHDLQVGDCMNGLKEADVVLTVDAVSCSEPHDAELYATVEVPDGDWPGINELSLPAEQRCPDEMAENFEAAYNDDGVGLFFLHPTSASWREGDREIDCIALYSEPRSGPLD